MKLMRMPWKKDKNPHGTLDIIGKCNISCKGCYNNRSGSIKPIEEVKKDFTDMMAQRRLHTVTLTGGEATLHPNLSEIISYISSQGVKVAVVSNGTLTDKRTLSALKKAGVDLIILHIQIDQDRPDLPASPTIQQVEELRNSKLQLIADHDIEAGVSYIIYKDRLDEFERLIRRMLSTEHTNFALFTMYSNFNKFGKLHGSLESGFRTKTPPSKSDSTHKPDEITAEELLAFFEKLNIRPFSYVASNTDINMKRWYLFLCGTVIHNDNTVIYRSLESSLLEKLMIQLSLLIKGKTAFFYKPNRLRFQAQLLFNAFMGGSLKKNFRLLRESWRSSAILQDKHFVLQKAPELMPNGEVVFCKDCPDATMRNGKLVPTCLVDRIEETVSGVNV